MELVEHWWNQSWGTMTRRDVKLFRTDSGWRVEATKGGRTTTADYGPGEEAEAREILALAPRTGGEWKQML